MDKREIAAFFDRCAPTWDTGMIRPEAVISAILDNAGVRANADILDVACGTGVLFADYLRRKAASVTAIDLSEQMVQIARQKYPQVEVLCGDVETAEFSRTFDVVMVYNAFPHFPEPERLISRLCALLKPGGRLSVAHSMSREKLIAHHSGSASRVSIDLLPAQELAELFARYCHVEKVISNDEMYQVTGQKRE